MYKMEILISTEEKRVNIILCNETGILNVATLSEKAAEEIFKIKEQFDKSEKLRRIIKTMNEKQLKEPFHEEEIII